MVIRSKVISNLAAIALGAIATHGVARAADSMDMAAYFESKKAGGRDWTDTEIFLTGIANGLTAANAELASKNQKLLFCAPSIALNFDNINEILESEYSAHPAIWQPSATIRSVLLVGLIKAFPCK